MKKFAASMLAVLMLATMAPGVSADYVVEKSPTVPSSASADYVVEKSPTVPSSASADYVVEKSPPVDINEKVLAWKAYNKDTVGWLYMPDTTINNVVVQGEDNSYYLRRNAQKETAFNGCYFADYRGDFSGGGLPANTVIYGHSFEGNPKGKKFSQLFKYLDDDFAAGHPYIYFADGGRLYPFRVFAVFTTDVTLPYNNPNMDAKTREKVLEAAKNSSVREYKSQPGETSKLLTLSTNAYTDGNGERVAYEGYPNNYRFVVMAYAVKNPNENSNK